MKILFSFFIYLGNVIISWINTTSAYIGLYRRDQAAVALSTLSQSDTYSIMTFSKRQQELMALETVAVSPFIEKKRPLEISVTGSTNISKKRKITNTTNIEEVGEKNSTSMKNKKRASTTFIKNSTTNTAVNKTFQEDNSWE